MVMWRSLVFVVLACSACQRPRGDDPAEQYLLITKSAQRGDSKTAFAALSSATQRKVEAQARELAALSDGGVRDDPPNLLFRQLQLPSAAPDITVTKRDANTAILKVVVGARTADVRMVLENGVWKLDLLDVLK